MTNNSVTIAQGTRHKAQGTRPLLSVIIPVYNVEKYLNKCIQSIVNQTYTNLEIILVNDGSIDSSPAICEEWAKRDSRVRVIHKENGGAGDSRNAALDTVKSPLIGIVDSDDYILPDMYEKLYNAMIENDADMSICSFSRVDANDNPLPRKRIMPESHCKVVSREEALNTFTKPPYYSEYELLWTKLYKSEIFKGIRFPKGNKHDDTATIHRIIGACNKIVLLNESLYVHRVHDKSVMGILRQKYFDIHEFHDRKFIYQDRYNYFMSINKIDLAKKEIIYAYGFIIANLPKVNYLQYRRDISPFMFDTIRKLIKSGNFKNYLRIVKLALMCLRSIFRPYLHEEQTK